MTKKNWPLLSVILGIALILAGQASGQQYNTNSSSSTSGQAQIFMQLQQMEKKIAQLQGQLEEQQLLIKQLQKEGLERYQNLDQRLSNNAASKTSTNTAVTPIDASAPLSPPAKSTEPADPDKERLYYDAAYGLIQKRDFPKAAQAFTAFINKFPQSQYAGNAQYWLAEVNLAQGDVAQAGVDFNKVVQNYPSHAKVPDAIYKAGDVQLRLGNKDKAKELFNQVLTKYPTTSAATLAKRSLQTLN